MISIRQIHFSFAALILVAISCCTQSHAQAALLMEEPYGFFGAVNPTGHNAIYFERICAETHVKLRRCEPREPGAVIARYEGIDGYDWVAIPLIPYLYSVENADQVPTHADRTTVERLRSRYREEHLMDLGENLRPGNLVRDGWTQLVGVAYERRIYAFRFETSPEQDDALIAHLNAAANRSHFNIFFGNCSDFSSHVLDLYFPGVFRRHVLPDGGITTPRQVAYELVRYARNHPELRLTVLEIPQIPGYRRPSRKNQSVADSLLLTGDVVPVALLTPFVVAAMVADSLLWGRYPLPLAQAEVLEPGRIEQLATAGLPVTI